MSFIFFAIPVIPSNPTTMSEHPDFLWWLALLLLSGLVFFVGRTLSKIDKNQSELFNRVNNVETNFAELKGEHTQMCSSLLVVLRSIDRKLDKGGE